MWLGLGLGCALGKIWSCEGVWVMGAAFVSVLGLGWLGVQDPHPDTPQANLSPASLPTFRTPSSPKDGCTCFTGEVAARPVNHRRGERERGPGARGAAGCPRLCHAKRGDPTSGASSSFPKASALLPSPEAGQGGSCRPCAIPGQERPSWQGKALGKTWH